MQGASADCDQGAGGDASPTGTWQDNGIVRIGAGCVADARYRSRTPEIRVIQPIRWHSPAPPLCPHGSRCSGIFWWRSQVADGGEVEREMQALRESDDQTRHRSPVRELLAQGRVVKLLMLGLGLGFVGPVTGVNAFMYYRPIILKSTGMGTSAAPTATIGKGVVSVVAVLLEHLAIGRTGQRPLLLTVWLSWCWPSWRAVACCCGCSRISPRVA